MTRRTKLFGIVVLAAALGSALLVTQISSASHVRPKGASPLRVSLVPAFQECLTPNRVHGAPLGFPSCNPPVQSSTSLTLGYPEGTPPAPANANGYILLRVKATSPEDVLIDSTGTDIRCQPGTAATVCNGANAADGPDYSGQLQGNTTIRISDHYNGPGLNEAATVVDIGFPVNATCANTAATTQGGICDAHTSANAVVPGSVKDAQRGVVELQQLQVFDGGPDGVVGTPGDTLFAVQGIFIP